MVNFIQKGETVTLAAPYAVASGEGAQVGALFGVAANTYALSEVGEFVLCGVFDLAKSTGVNWVVGAKLYWDNTAKSVTNVVSTNAFIGHALSVVINGDTVCRIHLHGASV